MNKLLKYARRMINHIINFFITTLPSFFYSFIKKKENTKQPTSARGEGDELILTYRPSSALPGDHLLPAAAAAAAAAPNNEDSSTLPEDHTSQQSILGGAETSEVTANAFTSATNTSTSSSGVLIPQPGNKPVLTFRGIGSAGNLQELTQGLVNAGGTQGYMPRAMQANKDLNDLINQHPDITELHLYGFSRGNHILLHSLQTINHKHTQIKKISVCLIDPVHGLFNQRGNRLPLENHCLPKETRADLEIKYYALISAGSNNRLRREAENIALPKTANIISAVPTDNLFFAPGGHTETPYSTNANKLAQLIQLEGSRNAVPIAFFGTTENPEEIQQGHVEHVLSTLGNLYNIPCKDRAEAKDLKRELRESSNSIQADGPPSKKRSSCC